MKSAEATNLHPPSVVTALYLRTKDLHVEAERSGIIRDLLRGNANRDSYVLLMRNLLPAYQALESGLDAHKFSPALSEIASFRLDRASAIEADLTALCGKRWSLDIPLVDAGRNYAKKIAEAVEGDGSRLIAHAYTRYLGDLSGGLILRKLLTRSMELRPEHLSFYSFPRFSDLAKLKSDYRLALDRAANYVSDVQPILDEGAAAFSLNIDLSWSIKNAAA